MPARTKLLAQAGAVLLVALLIGLLGWQVATRAKGQNIPAAVAKGDRPAAPEFDLPSLANGRNMSMRSLRGHVVVLNFWASWCGPCKDEAPLLEDAWQRYRDRGVVVLGVDAEDFSTDARRFIDRYGLTYPNVRDSEGSVVTRFGLTGYPETFFVNREGLLVAHVPQPIDGDDLDRGIELALSS